MKLLSRTVNGKTWNTFKEEHWKTLFQTLALFKSLIWSCYLLVWASKPLKRGFLGSGKSLGSDWLVCFELAMKCIWLLLSSCHHFCQWSYTIFLSSSTSILYPLVLLVCSRCCKKTRFGMEARIVCFELRNDWQLGFSHCRE